MYGCNAPDWGGPARGSTTDLSVYITDKWEELELELEELVYGEQEEWRVGLMPTSPGPTNEDVPLVPTLITPTVRLLGGRTSATLPDLYGNG